MESSRNVTEIFKIVFQPNIGLSPRVLKFGKNKSNLFGCPTRKYTNLKLRWLRLLLGNVNVEMTLYFIYIL
jgi:hypothetical protein